MGDGAEAEAGEAPAAQAGAQGGLPHAEAPDALSPPKGTLHTHSPVLPHGL